MSKVFAVRVLAEIYDSENHSQVLTRGSSFTVLLPACW